MFFDADDSEFSLFTERDIFDLNGDFYIAQGVWNRTKEKFTPTEICARLSSFIESGVLSFPYKTYSQQELKEDFLSLQAKEALPLYSSWECNRLAQTIPLVYRNRSVYLSQKLREGSKVSDQYTQAYRMEVSHLRYPSPSSAWNSPNKFFLKALLDERLFNGEINNYTLRKAITLRSYEASQFKPQSAKAIYDFFGAKNVLDFSAGWGDRLVGFLASGAESYVGIDPNTKLHAPYSQIRDFCAVRDKQTRFICAPAEEADLTGVEVDFVFTSPPYFTLERYSTESSQSWVRYTHLDAWLHGFLFPTLSKCWTALKEGGRIAINISDAYTQGQREDICTPMLRYMAELGATYEGVIGYQLAKRPGMNMDNLKSDAIFCEPIFIWSKGVAPEPKWEQDNFFGV
jgi:hypothetical protein